MRTPPKRVSRVCASGRTLRPAAGAVLSERADSTEAVGGGPIRGIPCISGRPMGHSAARGWATGVLVRGPPALRALGAQPVRPVRPARVGVGSVRVGGDVRRPRRRGGPAPPGRESPQAQGVHEGPCLGAGPEAAGAEGPTAISRPHAFHSLYFGRQRLVLLHRAPTDGATVGAPSGAAPRSRRRSRV